MITDIERFKNIVNDVIKKLNSKGKEYLKYIHDSYVKSSSEVTNMLLFVDLNEVTSLVKSESKNYPIIINGLQKLTCDTIITLIELRDKNNNIEHTVEEKIIIFKNLLQEMFELYKRKNANYGGSFSQLWMTLGPVSGLVPLHNKFDRELTLSSGEKNNFESIEDTLIDLANYSIMNIIEIQKDYEYRDKEKGITTFVDKPIKTVINE